MLMNQHLPPHLRDSFVTDDVNARTCVSCHFYSNPRGYHMCSVREGQVERNIHVITGVEVSQTRNAVLCAIPRAGECGMEGKFWKPRHTELAQSLGLTKQETEN